MSQQDTPRLAYSERDLDAAGILTRKTRWRMRRAGKFPEPVSAGSRKLYRSADIRAWLEDPETWAAEHRAGEPLGSGGRRVDRV